MTHVQQGEPATIPAVPGIAGSRTGARVVALDCFDVRFPTSLHHDGSDAMNTDPDYSAAYKDAQRQALFHIEIRGDKGRPLPMSETGYRSAFVSSSVIEAWGGVEAYVRGWLNLDYCCPREREEPEQFLLF